MTEVEPSVSGTKSDRALSWQEIEFSAGLERFREERGIFSGVVYHLAKVTGQAGVAQRNLRELLVNGTGLLGESYSTVTRQILENYAKAAHDITVVTDITTNGTPLYILDEARQIIDRQVGLCRLSAALTEHALISSTELSTILSKLAETFVFGQKEASLVEDMLNNSEVSMELRKELTRLYLRSLADQLLPHEVAFQPAVGLVLRNQMERQETVDPFLLSIWLEYTDLFKATDVEILVGLAHARATDKSVSLNNPSLVADCASCLGKIVGEVDPVQIALPTTTDRINSLLSGGDSYKGTNTLNENATNLAAAIALSLRILSGREYTIGIREKPGGFGVGVKWYLYLGGEGA